MFKYKFLASRILKPTTRMTPMTPMTRMTRMTRMTPTIPTTPITRMTHMPRTYSRMKPMYHVQVRHFSSNQFDPKKNWKIAIQFVIITSVLICSVFGMFFISIAFGP